MRCIRVLVAEDVVLFRKLLTQFLVDEPDLTIVGEAANGQEALDLVATTRPDVVLLDLDMPVIDGAAAARRLAEQWPGIRLVILDRRRDQAAAWDGSAIHSVVRMSSATPHDLLRLVRQATGSESGVVLSGEASAVSTMCGNGPDGGA